MSCWAPYEGSNARTLSVLQAELYSFCSEVPYSVAAERVYRVSELNTWSLR